MEEIFKSVIEHMLGLHPAYAYAFLFLSSIIENLVPPVPGDTITAFGAFLVGKGKLSYPLVFITTTAGSVTGFMMLYALGRFLGRRFFVDRNYPFFSAEKILNAEHWFQHYGYGLILGNRFLPGLRSVISLFSGISFLTPLRVMAYSIVSASVWNLIWIQMGFMLGNRWEIVKERIGSILHHYYIAIAVLIASAVIFYLVKKYIARLCNKRKPSPQGGEL